MKTTTTLLLLLAACGPPTWGDEPVLDLVNAHRFWVRNAGRVAPVEIRCTSTTEPGEEHVVRGVSGEELLVAGLLAEHTYECALQVLGQTEVRTLETGSLPADLPANTVSGTTTGYTLFSSSRDVQAPREPKLLVVDPQGRVRWYRMFPQNATDLDATWLPEDGTFLVGGGFAMPPHRLAPDGSIVAQAVGREDEPPHHHVEQRREGTVLTLVEVTVGRDGEAWRGFRIDELEHDLRGTVWSWEAQQAVDDGWLHAPEAEGRRDPYHANALVDLGDTLLVSLRQTSTIVALDRSSGDPLYTLGRGGDFDLVDLDGAPLPTTDWFFGQHAPKLDGDRLLVHDNGWSRPSGPRYSRVVEYALDHENRVATLVWSWTEPDWYEPIWGDADWLPDGQVLITRGHCENCRPNATDLTQLVQVDPETDQVVWRLVLNDPEDTGYRAQRIDGCSLFANRALCPDLE